MNRSWLAALSLAPLLGASQTLIQAGAMALLTVMAVLIHQASITPMRNWLDGLKLEIASLLIAAAVVTCLNLALQAHALALHLSLGIYPELVALQCLLFDRSTGGRGGWRASAWLLAGICVVYVALGATRELLASGTLHLAFDTAPGATGVRLASLAPGALLLLGLLLALINRACPKQATPDREGKS